MKRNAFSHILAALLWCSILASPLTAQQENCLPPVALPTVTEPNIFSQEQEVILGEAVAAHIQKDYHIIEDAEMTAFLTRIGERLNKYLPLTKMQFQFFLVDLPDANAFALPGGRIYVSRKLIALTQNEDELAGVLAHELGHLVAREHAIDITRRFKEILGVTQVTDRRDIFEKYNQMIDNLGRNPGAVKSRDREKGQLVADQAGFYALVSAGYDPAAQARFWDRMTETKGKKGSFFSDLFGSTRPEERRLREMLKVLSALPPDCVKGRTAAQTEEFRQWQTSVISYTGFGRRESLHGIVSKLQLSPPLRSDLAYLRFSPDGKYVLAQDDSGINVLTREPFAMAFRIEAPDARYANFTPDSQTIIFYTDNLRVEQWSIAEQKMTDAKEVVILNGCLQTKLSPDGKFLACLTPKFDLNILNVSSGQTVIQRKEFYAADYFQYFWLMLSIMTRTEDSTDLGINLINMGFSPDGHYFAAGYYGRLSSGSNRYDSIAEAFDMTAVAKMSLPDSIKKYLVAGFTFMPNDRLVGINHDNEKKSALIAFPSGHVISEFPLSRRTLIAPTRGDYLIVRPIKDYALGVMDLTTGTIFKVNKQPALDIFGDTFVAELRNGELGLYKMEKNVLLGSAQLSNFTLGRLYTAELSSDMKWLAMSGRSRGGVWNLAKGEAALYLRGFRGGYLGNDGFFYADFPKYEEAERNVAKFNLANGEVVPGPKIDSEVARQAGPYVITLKSAGARVDKPEVLEAGERPALGKNVILEMLDARTMSTLWSKPYPKEAPRAWVAPAYDTAVLVWDLKDEAAKTAIKSDPRLSQQLTGMKEKEGDYYLKVLDARTGAELGNLLIETGNRSFRMSNVFSAGDWVIVTDNRNRVLIYSLKSGAQAGRVFGGFATVSLANNLLCVENETGKLALYDLKSMEKRDEFVFSTRVSMVRFTPDGHKLFVLTSNQTAYLLDISSAVSK